MSCGKEDKYYESKRLAPAQSSDQLDFVLIPEDDITIREGIQGSKVAFYIGRSPYIPANVAWAFVPAAIEKGLVFDKGDLKLSLNVTKGRDDVRRIVQTDLAVDEADPALPFVAEWDYPYNGALGNTEAPSATVSVTDTQTQNKVATLQRPDRFFVGRIAKDPRTATFAELVAAATDVTAGAPGRLGSSIGSTVTVAPEGQFWFILHPTEWQFRLKTDLIVNPFRKDLGLQQPNAASPYTRNYTVACNSTPNFGTITYTVV